MRQSQLPQVQASSPRGALPSSAPEPRYAWYVLFVLVLVYVLNFLDRQILSILAEHIKADLALSDAQIGFLYGTAFAVFYAIFGIPLGRLADVWERTRLIAIGLGFWSLMTAVSGLARNFTQLAVARVGVGVGEASASPAAFSILSDYFPIVRRATALAIYSSGIYIGAGLGLGIGGFIVDRWDAVWGGTAAPFGLRGWQVAFFAVGLPGVFLSLWVRGLREPLRGQADGIASAHEAHPFREFGRELRAVLPPFTLLHLWLLRAGRRVIGINLACAAGVTCAAALLSRALGTPLQWVSLAIGAYAGVSWAQALGLRDPVAFDLIFRTPSLRYAVLGFSLLAFAGYGIGFWIPPFFMRLHGIDAAQAGLILGGTAAVAGWLGATSGGLVADRWRLVAPNGRLYVAMLTASLPVPLAVWMLMTPRTGLAFLLYVPAAVCAALWLGPAISTVQDLVLPRIRASASAAYLLVVTFVGLAMGPYTVGRLSVALGDLRTAMLVTLGVNVLALVFLLLAARHLARDEASKLERARALGERNLRA